MVGVFVPMVKESIELLYQFDRDFVVDSGEFEQRFEWGPVPLESSIATTARASR